MELKELFELKKDFKTPGSTIKNPVNIFKHLSIRFGVIIIANTLLFLGFYIEDSYDGMLVAIILSFILLLIWIVFLFIESIILYNKNKKSLGNANLIVAGIILFIITIGILDNL